MNRSWSQLGTLPVKGGDGQDGNHNGHDPHGAPGAPHFFVRYPEEEPLLTSTANTPVTSTHRFSSLLSPRSPHVKRRSNRTSMRRPLTEFEVDESPAVAQYLKLVGR